MQNLEESPEHEHLLSPISDPSSSNYNEASLDDLSDMESWEMEVCDGLLVLSSCSFNSQFLCFLV